MPNDSIKVQVQPAPVLRVRLQPGPAAPKLSVTPGPKILVNLAAGGHTYQMQVRGAPQLRVRLAPRRPATQAVLRPGPRITVRVRAGGPPAAPLQFSEITNNYAAVVCPDLVTRYIPLMNQQP